MENRMSGGGTSLLLLATLVSIQLSQGRTADETDQLGTFFAAVGSNLALLAASQLPPQRPAYMNEKSAPCPMRDRGRLELSKKANGLFRQEAA
ncbi:MAG TPA: hypothetical protein IAA94_03655 [Candidatus Galloscillospira stercoripullorum]|nr:hypothetical protein [Candidatus Galloscillospira stercoripullorum]